MYTFPPSVVFPQYVTRVLWAWGVAQHPLAQSIQLQILDLIQIRNTCWMNVRLFILQYTRHQNMYSYVMNILNSFCKQIPDVVTMYNWRRRKNAHFPPIFQSSVTKNIQNVWCEILATHEKNWDLSQVTNDSFPAMLSSLIGHVYHALQCTVIAVQCNTLLCPFSQFNATLQPAILLPSAMFTMHCDAINCAVLSAIHWTIQYTALWY